MRKSLLISIIALIIVVIAAAPTVAQTTSVTQIAEQEDKQVFAFYFGWWTQETWDTDDRLIDAPLNRYDVRDPRQVGTQIAAAQRAGIDAFIVDWLGLDNLTDEAFRVVLDESATRDFAAAAVVDLNERNYLNALDSVQEAMTVLLTDLIYHPGYLHLDGKPVIYFWNQERFSITQWQQLRDVLDPNYQTIWLMEGTNTSYIPTFQGMYLFNTVWSDDPSGLMNHYQRRTAMMGGDYFIPTALPGWNESAFAGWRPMAVPMRDRGEDGDFLRESWNAAISTGQDHVLVVSWNGYFENSHVQPSLTYGLETINTLRELIGDWKAE
jgi:hypothetical protein